MGKFYGHAVAWAISIAIALVVGEIFGAVLFHREHGGLVYRARPHIAPIETKDDGRYLHRIHPYVGFSLPNSLPWTNNLGFPQTLRYKIPFEPNENDFVVVVLGGSVAANLVSPPQSGLSFELALRERLKGKNVIVLSLAQGAGKQPQQIMALAMLRALGQRADIVLNLDGFNEFALGYENIVEHTHPIMPALTVLWAIGYRLEPLSEKTVGFYRIGYELTEAKSSLAFRTNAADQSRSGLSYLYNAALISLYKSRKTAAEAAYAAAVGTLEGRSGAIKAQLGVDMPPDQIQDPWEDLYQLWLRSSDELRDLSRGAGFKYLHIIQPNQYYSKRVFSPEESRTALSLPGNNALRVGTEHGYAMLEQRAEFLSQRGIISAIHLLDSEPGPMYIDNCCHYTKEGETILARFVAEQIASVVTP